MKNKIRLSILSAMLLISISSMGQNIRGFYLQDVGNWLGNTTAENDILNYAQGNGFNYILFYDLGQINWNSTSAKNQLASFISKARTQYGITQVGGVVEYAGYVTQYLLPYNNSRTNNNEKFNVINLEFEFWLSASASGYYCNKFLNAAGFSCDLAGAWQFAWREFQLIDDLCATNNMISEIYIGWPDQTQAQLLASRADRILLAAYRQNDGDIYAYSKPRLMNMASIGGSTKVITLLSAEPAFMGPWLNTHPQTQPFQTMSAGFASETGSFINNIDLEGYQWFTHYYLPKTILGTASITASGPVSICLGGNVTLTANSGTAYLWSPGGQTTRSITVSTADTYSVRVTNTGGAQLYSQPVQVTVSTVNTAPTVSLSGSPSFCPGGSVTLTSNQSPSYLWSNGATTQSITVSATGNYSVTTGNGSCAGTSAPVAVNAASTPIVPVITVNGSLNVCPGTIITLTSSPSNGYLWSNGATTRSIAVSSAGNYFVKAFTGPNCFAQSVIKTVANIPAPVKPIITAGSSTTLTGGSPSVTLTSSNANAYQWSTAAVTRSINVNSQGSYSVTVTGTNGCTATSNAINVNANGCTPPPVPVITSNGTAIIQSGQSTTLVSSLGSGYLWSTGEQTRSITVSSPGTYTVRTYNRGGCFSTSLPFNVTVLLAKMGNPQLAEDKSSGKFLVYPNPANEEINFVFHREAEEENTILLMDMTGREVHRSVVQSLVGENRMTMDISSLPRGIYFACLVGTDTREVIKLMVE